MLPRRTIAEVGSAVPISSIPGLRLAVTLYLCRVDGWRSFDEIADRFDTDPREVLRSINRVAIGLALGTREIVRLVEQARLTMEEDDLRRRERGRGHRPMFAAQV